MELFSTHFWSCGDLNTFLDIILNIFGVVDIILNIFGVVDIILNIFGVVDIILNIFPIFPFKNVGSVQYKVGPVEWEVWDTYDMIQRSHV